MADQLAPPSSGSVELKTAAYLEQLSAQPDVPAAVSTSPSLLTVLTQTARVCSGLLAVIGVLAIGISAMNVSKKDKDRRTCGVDWLLWASGSNKTFESILGDKLEEARRDFDRRWADSQPAMPPLDMQPFDANSFQPQFGGKK